MNKQLACHYCVVRFSPYPETDEFVNVGVVLACPITGYLDFKRADLRRRGRVGRFFPELEANTYSAALHAWDDSLKHWRRAPVVDQILTESDQRRQREIFKTIVRPRESILFYSETRVILSSNPATTLDEVFGIYVERRFANVPEYQERVMCRRLQVVLNEADLLQRYAIDEKIGNDEYQVRFPFVKREDGAGRPLQAIKALHLDRKNSTDIIRHADDWINVMRRLRGFNTAPQEVLFVLQAPSGGEASHVRAFDQVRRDLDLDKISHVAEDATSEIVAFAGR